MHVMADDRTRIDFNAPTSLVERADALADLLDTSRTRILVDALRDELDELTREEGVRREVRDAFYGGRVDFEMLESVLGTEEALRAKLLRDSLDRDPPEPLLEDVPVDEAFYDGEISEWTPDEGESEDTEDDVESPA
jgi:predicted transcriptional regulator